MQPYVNSFLAKSGVQNPIEIVIRDNPAIGNKLERGEIDVTTVEWWDERPDYVACPWRQQELVVIVAPDHPWAKLSAALP